MSSPEIGLHLFHPNAPCIASEKSGQIYFLSLCYAESFHGGEVRYAQDGTYYFAELATPYCATR
ncbi:hypothetical protein, partial [Pseudomonas corrugata]|uniref:hypothetical protein n=1 Tax=Pseudomonas corrugata TaxID=47879 RepID=UPI001E5281BA